MVLSVFIYRRVAMQCLLTVMLFLSAAALTAQSIAPYGPLPTARQQQWHEMEFYLFVHFGPNTFTDLEWGHGNEKEEVFNPAQLDCAQWCRIAKAAGAKGIIITAKHHDGFCLWPSKYSTHTIAQSKWKNGKGDVLRELSNACKKAGLKFGVYLSPWDRNHPAYGTDAYNDVYVNMMTEILHNYGPLFEFWWDGANGEGPNGKKQQYDFNRFETIMRTLAPHTVVFSDIGPDIRWVGNEKGIAGDPNWNLLDTAGFSRGAGAPHVDTLNHGNMNGNTWIPAECDVSIRPGWFYHKNEDEKVKSPEQLFDLYLKSVGRGASFLLNVPADGRGLFTGYDSSALVGFRKLLDDNFKTSLLDNKDVKMKLSPGAATMKQHRHSSFISLGNDYSNQFIEIDFPVPTDINCISLREPTQLGQRVMHFTVETVNEDGTSHRINKNTIGRKRIVTFPAQKARSLRIRVTDAKATPLISDIRIYKIDDRLVEKD